MSFFRTSVCPASSTFRHKAVGFLDRIRAKLGVHGTFGLKWHTMISAFPFALQRCATALALHGALVSLSCAQSAPPVLNLAVDPIWPRLPQGWTFEETAGIAVDAREHFFVFHRGPQPIIEFDRDGNFVRSWGDGIYVRPHGLKFDREGNLWAVDDGGQVVVKLDSHGRSLMVLGRKATPGETDENFDRPTDVAFEPNGNIYVADGYGNSRVVQFDSEGRFVRAWGKKGKAPGEFDLPHSIAVDRMGRVYVGDRTNFRIQIFSPDGKFITEWKQAGSPWGLCLTEDDFLFVCDGYANRIVKLALDGSIVGTASGPGKLPGQLNFVHHIAVRKSGSVYVAEI